MSTVSSSPAVQLHHVRRGTGKPLLLVHGLGGSHRSWGPIIEPLAAARETVGVDLPGFGQTPPLEGPPTIAAQADALEAFLVQHDLVGVDAVGSSMGARLVLELARRGKLGAVVALDPGGFWEGGALTFFNVSVKASIGLVRALQPVMRLLTGNPVTRTVLFAQFSVRPWKLDSEAALSEMRDFGRAQTIFPTLRELVHGPAQEGAPRGTITKPLVIGWGRQDRVTLPSQAKVAQERFPDAQLHWFEKCGHFPHWDQPEQTVELILRTTA